MDKSSNDGLYIKVKLFDVAVNSLIDTGSTITVLHPRKYFELDERDRPCLKPDCGQLRMADGGAVTPLGIGEFKITLCGVTVDHPVIVADIEAPMILGYDFLHDHDCQLHLGTGVLTFRGQSMQCTRETKMSHIFSVFRIKVQDTVLIPPRCEMIVTGKLESDENQCVLVEPSHSSLTLDGILVARTLVQSENGQVPLRVMNTTDSTFKLYKNTNAAVAETGFDLESTCCNGTSKVFEIKHNDVDTTFATYMKPLWDSCRPNLSDGEQNRVSDLLLKYIDVFAKSKTDMGRTDIVQHKINTGSAQPIKQPPRRVPYAKRDEAAQEVQRMLDTGVIEPSNSPWSSPVVLVTKKDGSLRYCIDYRKLNSVTIKDSYPLPRIDDSLDALRGSKWFSCLDLASGYWQLMLDPADKEKTAFVTQQGLFQFRVLPFGLCNAPATFERLMESVLAGLNFETCLLYLDDIIVFSDTFEKHIDGLEKVLQRLRSAGLKVFPKKCQFFQEEVAFLGHVVNRDGIATSPDKISAVQEWPIPNNVHDVRSFLGTCSYYRRFIKNFAEIARPLHRLTEKHASFHWTEQCQESFQSLKRALTTSPILRYPKMELPFILDTDASGFALGAVLSQIEDGKEQVIAYYSKSFSKCERNYCVTRRELLAIVSAVKHFHHYLYGKHFTVRTDHGALSWLLRFKNPEGQMARWIEILQTYDIDIVHRPGRLHGNSDGLSRRPCEPCDYCSRRERKDSENQDSENTEKYVRATTTQPSCSNTTDIEWYTAFSSDDLRKMQENDPVIAKVLQWKIKGVRPMWNEISPDSPVVKTYWSQWARLFIKDGLLYRKWEHDGSPHTDQLVVPTELQQTILQNVHDNPTSGHLGIARTTERIKQRFYWVGYKDTVTKYCQTCTRCQGRKNPYRKSRGKLSQYIVGAPLERVALDILGPLPQTKQGNKYILVVVDYFTK